MPNQKTKTNQQTQMCVPHKKKSTVHIFREWEHKKDRFRMLCVRACMLENNCAHFSLFIAMMQFSPLFAHTHFQIGLKFSLNLFHVFLSSFFHLNRTYFLLFPIMFVANADRLGLCAFMCVERLVQCRRFSDHCQTKFNSIFIPPLWSDKFYFLLLHFAWKFVGFWGIRWLILIWFIPFRSANRMAWKKEMCISETIQCDQYLSFHLRRYGFVKYLPLVLLSSFWLFLFTLIRFKTDCPAKSPINCDFWSKVGM